MAKVRLSTLVADVRNRLGNVVFSKWKDTNYVREYTNYSRGNSERQVEIRNAFALLVSIWKNMANAMHASWNSYAKDMNMTGFNAFIKANSARVLDGEALELFKKSGVDELLTVSVEGNASAGEIVCSLSLPENSGARYIVFFVQRILDENVTDDIRTYKADLNPASQFTITGLEPGAEYFVYAILANSEYASAEGVSASVSMRATAGV
ncbi:MAG: hypothetical protein JXN64_12010 [Spirochaetes bacterium]|nr:hypothetical protein [Spirochaetota bacterium]